MFNKIKSWNWPLKWPISRILAFGKIVRSASSSVLYSSDTPSDFAQVTPRNCKVEVPDVDGLKEEFVPYVAVRVMYLREALGKWDVTPDDYKSQYNDVKGWELMVFRAVIEATDSPEKARQFSPDWAKFGAA